MSTYLTISTPPFTEIKTTNAISIYINFISHSKNCILQPIIYFSSRSVTEFKEFERRFKFKPRFKYGWFYLKLYQMFQDLSRR